jgi:hypothetical protein
MHTQHRLGIYFTDKAAAVFILDDYGNLVPIDWHAVACSIQDYDH